ncbi:MAG: NADH-quinone oxidoreductase subunit J [Cyclobacteriaceae bacterium]|nr:NADH-quinone oxidoreductase subunit J [Cyclobacteriaceae bacterium]
MDILFYITSAVAVISTIMVITRYHAVHALLYLVVSFLSIALIFYFAGAPFIAALEVIIYAGAIMVLFIFVVMMLNLGPRTMEQERGWTTPAIWIGPSILSAVLLVAFMTVLMNNPAEDTGLNLVGVQEVGISLFTEYLLAVELTGLLLMAAIIGAYHLGSREKKIYHRYLEKTDQ